VPIGASIGGTSALDNVQEAFSLLDPQEVKQIKA